MIGSRESATQALGLFLFGKGSHEYFQYVDAGIDRQVWHHTGENVVYKLARWSTQSSREYAAYLLLKDRLPEYIRFAEMYVYVIDGYFITAMEYVDSVGQASKSLIDQADTDIRELIEEVFSESDEQGWYNPDIHAMNCGVEESGKISKIVIIDAGYMIPCDVFAREYSWT